ncbi:hypothetical protein BDU57DRAFT_523094 [Ampelomyces quisqualis]|uniref:Uncharacterized protein n=1 Tax=Ampelomyces quisqualis TaxID=50730 RepID=A0A6A5QAY8_AMPQU|nr:hypothetical protein BDU57DRAFT_523094 [Ampelomyces quisqualis]
MYKPPRPPRLSSCLHPSIQTTYQIPSTNHASQRTPRTRRAPQLHPGEIWIRQGLPRRPLQMRYVCRYSLAHAFLTLDLLTEGAQSIALILAMATRRLW